VRPDSFMPFYGDDFLTAVAAHPDFVIVGYLKAIWYYWSHTHCEGLDNNPEGLRKICQLDREQWDVAERIIFDNNKFFSLGPDLKWHQKRAFEEWQRAEKSYNQKVAAGVKGAKKRWK